MDNQAADLFQIQPINNEQRSEVINATALCIAKAGQLYAREFPPLPVIFDLRGKCAGMYRRDNKHRKIRYNPWLFAKYYQRSLEQTVPHEVAHYITDCLWGIKSVKPHGKEWKSVITALGGDPVATGDYSLDGIPVRQYQRFAYQCGCRTHQLTIIRHRRVQADKANYRCRHCGEALRALVQ